MAIILKSEPTAPLTSSDIKLAVMKYYRFKRGFDLVCSECNMRDVFAIKFAETMKVEDAVEIEVKISKQDLIRDLKKPKHSKGQWTQFFYAVPPSLVEFTIEFCKKEAQDYGVIQVHGNNENYVTVCRRAEKTGYDLKAWEIKVAIKRMSCEILTLRTKQERLFE